MRALIPGNACTREHGALLMIAQGFMECMLERSFVLIEKSKSTHRGKTQDRVKALGRTQIKKKNSLKMYSVSTTNSKPINLTMYAHVNMERYTHNGAIK